MKWSDLSRVVQTPHSYSHAPITEAIIQVRVRLDPDFRVDTLRSVLEDDPAFGPPDAQIQLKGQVEINEGIVSGGSTSGETVGFSFTKADGSRIIQSWLNRFAFSWVAKYTDWEQFRNEALSYWDRYRAITKPLAIEGVSVRFINKIVVPAAQIEIKDYLRTSVEVSPYLPQAIAGLFMQVTIPFEFYGSIVSITSTLVPPEQPEQTALILDIDAIRADEGIACDATSDEWLVSALDVLRGAKNYVFEACITDATRRLIE